VIAAVDSSSLKGLTRVRPPNATTKLVLFNAPDAVAEPYYGDYEGFRTMFRVIHDAMHPFLTNMACFDH
jgi:protein-tyrosine-phosphatase